MSDGEVWDIADGSSFAVVGLVYATLSGSGVGVARDLETELLTRQHRGRGLGLVLTE